MKNFIIQIIKKLDRFITIVNTGRYCKIIAFILLLFIAFCSLYACILCVEIRDTVDSIEWEITPHPVRKSLIPTIKIPTIKIP